MWSIVVYYMPITCSCKSACWIKEGINVGGIKGEVKVGKFKGEWIKAGINRRLK